ncbi:MAG TPA: TadE/TadG family type IV pilus assembly protein [Steroidobacteraceae bacterium]|nr:TadE/TadG family type IV pilus assembly protein [Steroidobacteraceae bacterium]
MNRITPANRRAESGLVMVEFAIIGAVFFVVLFAVIEFGRTLFVINTLTEASRRAARMAAVCPVGSAGPANAAVTGAGGNPVIGGLSTGNVVIEYLDTNGAVLGNPATGDYGAIRYVRARITGFTLPLVIPFIMPMLSLSGFQAVLPRESLGITPTATETC